MTIGLKAEIRDSRMTPIKDALDAGGATPGTLTLYGGTRPATGAAITLQALAGVLTLSAPCGTVTGGDLVFAAMTGSDAVGGIPITWGRFRDGAGVFVMDASVGAVGSGADIEIDDTNPDAGIPIGTVGTQILRGGNA